METHKKKEKFESDFPAQFVVMQTLPLQLQTYLYTKYSSPYFCIFLFSFLETFAPSILQTVLSIWRFEIVIFDTVRVPFQYGPSRFLAEFQIALNMLLKLYVRYPSAFRFVYDHTFPGGFDVVVHSEIGGASVYQHALVTGHRGEFVVSFPAEKRFIRWCKKKNNNYTTYTVSLARLTSSCSILSISALSLAFLFNVSGINSSRLIPDVSVYCSELLSVNKMDGIKLMETQNVC